MHYAGSAARQNRRLTRRQMDKGLVDLLPQILLFLLACVIFTFWLPISRWIGALFLPWLQHTDSLHQDSVNMEPFGANGSPASAVIMAHA